MQMPDGKIQDFRVDEHGQAQMVDGAGHAYGDIVDLSDDMPEIQEDVVGWQILSHFAALPTARVGDDTDRFDLKILLELGVCPFPLMRPARDPIGHLVHDVPGHGSVLCEENGVIEPMTAAMQRVFSKEGPSLDAWFDEALNRRSLALLTRILIALRQVQNIADPDTVIWAANMLQTRILPAIDDLLAGNSKQGA